MQKAENLTGVFCEHGLVNLQTTTTGKLANLRLAVKDLFAVKGLKNSAGNPDWLKSSSVADEHSFAVAQLLNEGCQFVGLTHTDEIAYSLEGNNLHFGAAENPRFPGHACGGSTMGSAAAVAADLADIGLGTDTGGSIRIPASYCGLYGIRPSHGVINSKGLIPLAPEFDTTGWLTRDAKLLADVADVLLPEQSTTEIDTLFVCDALLELVEPQLAEHLKHSAKNISPYFDIVKKVEIPHSLLAELADTFRVLQGREIARTHGEWINNKNPTFTPPIEQRFKMALALTEQDEAKACSLRDEFRMVMADILSPTSALFLPTTPTTAPKLGADTTAIRMNILSLTAIAGLTGSVQIHLPDITIQVANYIAPYGYSLMSQSGNDKSLLALVSELSSKD